MRATEVFVDLRDVTRQLIHAKLSLPVQPGQQARLTLPLWLCESHGPNGLPGYIAGLVFTDGNQRRLAFGRDAMAPNVYTIDIPSNVSTVHASFDAVCSPTAQATRQSAMFEWESVLLHSPQGDVRKRPVKASILLPAGWAHSTSLKVDEKESRLDDDSTLNKVHFAPTTMERLQDSPILIGRHLVTLPITPDHREIFSLAAPSAEQATVPPFVMKGFHRLIHETHAALGPPCYRQYTFLTLQAKSGAIVGGGIEHAESAELYMGDMFSGPEAFHRDGDLFSHEYIHSWNGKFRRPDGHNHESWLTPLDGRLLWVYEGLTSYLALVLAARAGIGDIELLRQKLATILADQGSHSARLWRSIEDAGAGASVGGGIGRARSPNWRNYTSGMDYYSEGVLIWLEIDALLRTSPARQIDGVVGDRRPNLDDFCRDFFNTDGDCTPRVKTYTLQDICTCLAKLAPRENWTTFLAERVQKVRVEINTRGTEHAGYHFGYVNEPGPGQEDSAFQLNVIWYTLGIRLDIDVPDNVKVQDVRRYSAADEAKLGPGQVITEVNGEKFQLDLLMKAVRRAKEAGGRIVVKVEQQGDVWEATMHWETGLLYPRLWRVDEQPDLLSEIIVPRCDGSKD